MKMLVKFAAVILFTPVFLIAGVLVGVVGRPDRKGSGQLINKS